MNEREIEGRERNTAITTADLAAVSRTTDQVRDAAGGDMRPRQNDDPAAPLLPQDELGRLKSQWNDILGGFVDEPRRSVEEADGLVATTIKRLAESFASTRSGLESQWSRGGDVSTEDLRVALQHYRSFFERLVAV